MGETQDQGGQTSLTLNHPPGAGLMAVWAVVHHVAWEVLLFQSVFTRNDNYVAIVIVV